MAHRIVPSPFVLGHGLVSAVLLGAGCATPAPPPLDPEVPTPNVVRAADDPVCDTLRSGDARRVLYCGPAFFGDEPVTALRMSANVRLMKGNGRLRGFLFVHHPGGVFPAMHPGRIVRPGELPHDEEVPLNLEIGLGDAPLAAEDRLQLVLANEGGNRLVIDDLRITSVTRDVPGRPSTNGAP
ncbi:MAG TPA: hypothetical protein VGE21_09225 [Flavobacteriales bacterium]